MTFEKQPQTREDNVSMANASIGGAAESAPRARKGASKNGHSRNGSVTKKAPLEDARAVLGAVPANVLIADEHFAIVFASGKASATLEALGDELADTLAVGPDELIGAPITLFHAQGDRAQRVLKRLTGGTVDSRIELGAVPMTTCFSRVRDADGATSGYVCFFDTASKSNVRLEQGLERGATAVGTSSNALLTTSEQMAENAASTSSQAMAVAGAADQVNANVHSVAAAVEELTASVKEIARSAAEASRVASEGMELASKVNAIISKLGDSSGEIGKVIKVITSIAQQTNLLALNATIEAARAGAAGKGFAVVANEVKELAKATGAATEDIGRKIDAIQRDTTSAVEALKLVSAIIGQVNDIQGFIAVAVTEQTATTTEIGRSLSEAALGTSQIARSISTVAQAVQETRRGAEETQDAARSLGRMAVELQGLLAARE